MRQRGIVQEVSKGYATVAVAGGEGCGACKARASCMSITGRAPEAKIITVENTHEARTGDAVELELPVSATMQVIAVTFLVPVALLLIGYWIMMPAGSTQAALGAVGGLVVGMAIALVANRRLSGLKTHKMVMTGIVEKNCQETEVGN